MLRTSLLYALSVLLALGVLLLSLFSVTYRVGRVHGAVTKTLASPMASPVVTPTPVNYALPYPGILPDSPIWFLKAVRDQIVLWLSWDSTAKYQQELLLADKRLGAAQALIQGGKVDVGVVTAVKGEKYLLESVTLFVKIPNTGPAEKDLLVRAVAKHEEVLTSLQSRSPELTNSLKEAVDINRTVAELLK